MENADLMIQHLPVSTTFEIPCFKVKSYVGLVRGGTVRSKHLGTDVFAKVQSGTIGGELKGYTKLLADAREEAIYRMKKDAHELGANGIVGMAFASSTIDVGAAEITAFGTAVVVEPSD